jgi:hypothetical protein
MRYRRTRAILLAGVLCTVAGAAAADPVTFAQVSEGTAGNGIIWTDNGNGSATMNTATPGGDLVSFSFGSIPGLANPLTGQLQAVETINGGLGVTTTAAALTVLGFLDVQPINAAMTISYTLVTPIDGLTNLLTVTIDPDSPGDTGMVFSGQAGGSGASSSNSQPFSGPQTYTMSFSSAFLDIVLTEPISADFSYSSLSPAMQIGSDGLLGSFSAEDTATFSAAVFPADVQEPASFGLLIVGAMGLCALRVRRLALHVV